jgi:hypothetical protein
MTISVHQMSLGWGRYANRVLQGLRASLIAGTALLLILGQASAQPSNLDLNDAPTWLHYFCDGSEVDPNGSVAIQGAHCYQNLTVPSDATLNVTAVTSDSNKGPQDTPVGAFFAFVSGLCRIAGTIDSSGINLSCGNGGGAGGAGGGASSRYSGANGTDSQLFGNGSSTRVAAGGHGAGIGLSGGSGAAPSAATQKFVVGDALSLGELGGSSGGVGGGNPPIASGKGGGGIALICGSVNFTGAIRANGSDGAPGEGRGGGGGGGGGVVLIVSPNYVADSGTISVNGGAGGHGGAGAGNGGKGGKGWFRQFQLQ